MLLARIRSNVRKSIWRYSQAHSFASGLFQPFLSTTSLALAQSPEDAHHLRTAVSDRNERQFLFARDLAVSDVSRASLFEPTGNVDRNFVAMIPPGQAIIDMARAELLYGRNDELRNLAETVVAQQQQQISMMNGAMASMASMQTEEELLASTRTAKRPIEQAGLNSS
jgi:ParB-like chromosome segregation protein Spo0J